MKRSLDVNMEEMSYDAALKKVNLMDRNAIPNGAQILSLSRTFAHESSDIICLAAQIDRADESIKEVACGKLSLILEQIKLLQSQAKRILEETERNSDLHHAGCNFQKVPGKIYHLYRKECGQTFFSMLSPEEWGSAQPSPFIGSYRLERDSSWTPVDEIASRDRRNHWGEKLLFSARKGDHHILSIDYDKV